MLNAMWELPPGGKCALQWEYHSADQDKQHSPQAISPTNAQIPCTRHLVYIYIIFPVSHHYPKISCSFKELAAVNHSSCVSSFWYILCERLIWGNMEHGSVYYRTLGLLRRWEPWWLMGYRSKNTLVWDTKSSVCNHSPLSSQAHLLLHPNS